MAKIAYRRITAGGLKIFYREAGHPNAPTMLLLHGFPTASHMFRDLLPRLAGRFRLIAPDLPGFGQSAMPADGRFDYTFENLAWTMMSFTEALKLERFAMYVFDYGAPVGLRMALEHPERIAAIISQNGNAYDEGLSAGWDSMKDYWSHPTVQYRESLRAALTPKATRYQYGQALVIHRWFRPTAAPWMISIWPGLVRTRSRSNCSPTMAAMSRYIPNSRNTSACTNPRSSRSGERTTPTFCPPGQKPSDVIYLVPKSVSLTPATSLWRRIAKRSR